MAFRFDEDIGQLKAPFGQKYDSFGRVVIFARAHDTLTAGTPYRIKYDEFGPFTAALATDSDDYRLGIAKKAYIGDAVAELVHGGYYSAMNATASLVMAIGEGIFVSGGTPSDFTADYDDLGSNFALSAATTSSTTQPVVMIPEVITATS